MQICPPNEEKWVLCASKQEDYQRWCIVLEKFVQEKVVFIPGTNGMSPINYASDDDGYRSNASFRSGTSTPEAQSRSKSTSDPNCPSASVLSNVVRRGTRQLCYQSFRKLLLTIIEYFIYISSIYIAVIEFVLSQLHLGLLLHLARIFFLKTALLLP